MTTHPQGERPHEDDPTGVSALLRGLPDPGPMPEDLAARISAGLRDAQSERQGGTRATRIPIVEAGPQPSEQRGPSPWTLAPGTVAQTAPAHDDAVSGTGAHPAVVADELAARRRQRHRRVTALLGVAAALTLFAAGGAYLAQAPDSTVTAEPVSVQPSSPGATAAPQDYRVVASGKNYTAQSFTDDARSLATGQVTSDAGALQGRRDARDAEANPALLAPCVKGLLDDLMARPEGVTVDFARFEGRDALIVLVRRGGKTTAWAVGTRCTVDNTEVLAGPSPVDA